MTSFTSRVTNVDVANNGQSSTIGNTNNSNNNAKQHQRSGGLLKKFDFVVDTSDVKHTNSNSNSNSNHNNHNSINNVDNNNSNGHDDNDFGVPLLSSSTFRKTHVNNNNTNVINGDVSIDMFRAGAGAGHDDDTDLMELPDRSDKPLHSISVPNSDAPVFHAHTAPAAASEDERPYFATPFWRVYWERTIWLVGLLLLQSYASLILEQFEALLQKHLVITLFLPMLIGAGGNASNQSAMVVVRGIATGELTSLNTWKLIFRELSLAIFIGLSMGTVAYIRVYLFHSTEGSSAAAAVGMSTLAVMLLAIALGTFIPLMLKFVRLDPAHAGPVVAVLVDLSGVAIILLVCQLILN